MTAASTQTMKSAESSSFGRLPSGEAVELYTLTNSSGHSVKITNFGGIVTSINIPDKDGVLADVVLGFDNLESYLKDHPFFGAICGRIAGRISDSNFELEGQVYSLEVNDSPNHLHGGSTGFDKVLWSGLLDQSKNSLVLKHTSPHMDAGYPGELQLKVEYSWTDQSELIIDYQINTDRTTIVNVTNHSYFNLSGQGNVLSHILQIDADDFTPTDENMTLLGNRQSVVGEANDFRDGAVLGDRIDGIYKQHGDTYFCHGGRHETPRKVASVHEPKSGRFMELVSCEPVVQFYSGVGLDGSLKGKSGQAYESFAGLCLEAQEYADAINSPEMGNYTLHADETFESTTIYRFGVK
ncbi:MAG: galactose mutarotase [Lentisphaeraceae bacterium]|nr:galactose mutarotase [Lentisphaeraceae bacterium]